jgi:hypothetical protein
LFEQCFFTLLFKVLKIVGGSAFRLGRPIDNVACNVPLLSFGDFDSDALANERSSWLLISDSFSSLGKDYFGVSFSVTV